MNNLFGSDAGQLTTRYRPAPEVRASVHDGGVVLLHAGTGAVFSANRVGATIWQRVAQTWDVGQVVASVSAEFQVARQEAQKDTTEFVAQLEAAGLVIRDRN
jgi:hypothetical protein